MLTHVSKDQITVENTNVVIEDDEAAVMTVNRSSGFVLSGGPLSISKAKVMTSNCIYSGKLKKPAVTVKLNGRKLDAVGCSGEDQSFCNGISGE